MTWIVFNFFFNLMNDHRTVSCFLGFQYNIILFISYDVLQNLFASSGHLNQIMVLLSSSVWHESDIVVIFSFVFFILKFQKFGFFKKNFFAVFSEKNTTCVFYFLKIQNGEFIYKFLKILYHFWLYLCPILFLIL
jgi:hypothetical protein